MKLNLTITLISFFLFSLSVKSQISSHEEYAKITPEDFAPTAYTIDSSADAVILTDIGKADFDGRLVYHVYRKARILRRAAFHLANVSNLIYTHFGARREIEKVYATTYNLMDGKVVKTDLNKKDVFTDNVNEDFSVVKFALPDVKEGCIIEYSYTINISDFTYLPTWFFQNEYPTLWSEYTASVPEFFRYLIRVESVPSFYQSEERDRRLESNYFDNSATRTATERRTLKLTDHHWIATNLPGLKEESFTSTIDNYRGRVEFQLSKVTPPLQAEDFLTTWDDLAKRLLKYDHFGNCLDDKNGWLDDTLAIIAPNSLSDLERAKSIYNFVRKNFTCTRSGGIRQYHTLKETWKNHSGNTAEINLLMTAMFRKSGISCSPVILSTRDNGFLVQEFPTADRLNYVLSRITIDSNNYLLDASDDKMGFGKIPLKCYNHDGVLIDTKAVSIDLSPDSVVEKSNTVVILNSNTPSIGSGMIKRTTGYYSSVAIRDSIRLQGEEKFIGKALSNFPQGSNYSDLSFDSLNTPEAPITMKLKFSIPNNQTDLIYFNPILFDRISTNPFQATKRRYPVELPNAIDESYSLSYTIPDNFTVDELPTSLRLKINDAGDGYFDYSIIQNGNVISLKTRLKISKTTFLPEEYESLREFYNMLVKKQAEQITLKKV